MCAPRGSWEIGPVSGNAARVWALEVFLGPVLPSEAADTFSLPVCPHLGPTLGWVFPSLPTGSPVTFSASPSLTVGRETES